MLRLVDVTPDNCGCNPEVNDYQKESVASRDVILARAYVHRELRSRAVFIGEGSIPVGMALWMDAPQHKAYNLDQFFIDRRYQRKGYGRAALTLLLEELRKDGKYKKVVLRYVEGNEDARKFYEDSGFYLNGDDFEDEIGMELPLEAPSPSRI